MIKNNYNYSYLSTQISMENLIFFFKFHLVLEKYDDKKTYNKLKKCCSLNTILQKIFEV